MDYWTNILDEESLKYNLEFTAIFVMFYYNKYNIFAKDTYNETQQAGN